MVSVDDPRVAELLEVAAALGGLPLPVAQIIALEDAGHVVDLETGAYFLADGQPIAVTGEGQAAAIEWKTFALEGVPNV